MTMLKSINRLFVLGVVASGLAACIAGPDDTGVEYAPQMYHSTP